MRKGAQAGARTKRRTDKKAHGGHGRMGARAHGGTVARAHRRTGALAHWRTGALAAKPLIYTLFPVFSLYNIRVVII